VKAVRNICFDEPINPDLFFFNKLSDISTCVVNIFDNNSSNDASVNDKAANDVSINNKVSNDTPINDKASNDTSINDKASNDELASKKRRIAA